MSAADTAGGRSRRERRRRNERAAVFAGGLAILAAGGALALWSLSQDETESAWVAHTHRVLETLSRIRVLAGETENGRRGYVLTGDPGERARYATMGPALDPALADLGRLTADNPEQRRDLRLLAARVDEWRAVLAASVAEFDRAGYSQGAQAGFTDRSRIAGGAVREVLSRMEARENALLEVRGRARRASVARTRLVVLFGFGSGLLLVAAAGLSASRDFGARIAAERRLREREELFRLLVESVDEYAIFLLDPDGRVATWTESARRLKGYTAEEAIGLAHSAFYPAEVAAAGRPAELLRIALAHGRAEDEGWRVRKDGSRFWADVVVTPMRSGGRLLGYAKVTRDMTERREATRKIEELNEGLRRRAAQLAATNAELESFAYSVSHDLRAPLRAIDGFSQALLEDAGDGLTEAAKRDLDRIRAAARRMGELIDALLALSRVTRQPLQRGTVDLSAIAVAFAEDLRRSEPARSAVFRIAPDLTAEGDERLLRVVLQNLVANAWKFTAGRTDAEITVGRDSDGAFFVRDNGAGFDMAYAAQLFLPFHRLHGAAEFPGTGIGLATAARIVRRHGGTIRAEGRPGEGAAFYFTL
ncbi:MAG TPA: CHASE3 domain-containing protein [Thermoanaerobaculia bacterium]|nr:CHASE3 domain-containing protein [Thermoanaerobaculia bacterium]